MVLFPQTPPDLQDSKMIQLCMFLLCHLVPGGTWQSLQASAWQGVEPAQREAQTVTTMLQ